MDAVSTLVDCREGIIHTGKARLGSAFREEDVPSAQDLRASYDVVVRVVPLQDPSDFRLDGVSDKDIAEIKKDALAAHEAQMTGVIEDIVGEVKDLIEKVIEKTEGDPDKVKFNSLIKSITTACEAIAKFDDLLKDSGKGKLNKIVHDLNAMAEKHSAAALKSSKATRDEVKKDAKGLMAALSSI